jgi:hypothetical protein
VRLERENPTSKRIIDLRQKTQTNSATKRNLGQEGSASMQNLQDDVESAVESMETRTDTPPMDVQGPFSRPDRGAFATRPLSIMGGALAPAESNNDDIDSFIMAAAETDGTVNSDKVLEGILGGPDETGAGRPVDQASAQPQMGIGAQIGQHVGDIFYRAPQSGIRNAVQETIDLTAELGNQINELSDGTILDFAGRPVYQNGEWFPDVVSKAEGPQLPSVSAPVTTIGNIEKSVVQFITSFALAGKFLRGIGVAARLPTGTRAVTQGFVAAFAGFDGHEERLSNLLTQSENPLFNNTVTQFLAAREEDPELVGRLKSGLEEMGFGLAAEGFIQALRGLRAARQVRESTGAATFEEAAKKIESGESDVLMRAENQPMDKIDQVIGSSSTELVIKPGQVKIPEVQTPGVREDMFTQGQATAGMSPVQYGDQTVHVNFNRMDTIDDVNRALDEIVTTGKVTPATAATDVSGRIMSLSEEQIGALPKKQQDQYKFYIQKRRELVNQFNKLDVADPDLLDVDRRIRNLDQKMEATFKTELTGLAPPGSTGRAAAPSPAPQPPVPPGGGAAPKPGKAPPAPKRGAQVPNWDDATVPGAQNTWDLLIAARDRRKLTGKVDPLSADRQEALRVLWLSASNKLADVIRTAKTSPNEENLFAFRKMFTTFGLINNEVRGIRQETARAVNIWRKPERIPMRRMKEVTEALERSGGITDNRDLLNKIAAHLDDEQGGGALALANMAVAANKYGSVRALRSFWTLGLLTNWKTHEVNAISNTFTMFQMVAERAAAAQYSRLTGQVDGVAPGEAAAMLRGMWDNLTLAAGNAGRTFRTGEGGGAFQKIEHPFHHQVFEDPNTSLKKFANTSMWYWGGIGRALQAADEFFKTLNHGAAVNAEIHRRAYNEVLSGKMSQDHMASRITELKNDVPEDILLKAEDYARYTTFTKEPGKITKAFSRLMARVPGGRYIVPFINTPANLFQAAIERTPFVMFQRQFKDAIARGGADEAIAMTKLTMGMSITSMGIAKSFDGEITGSGPPFWSGEYARWKATGKQPYSIKVGDKWVSYNRFDPLGMVLGLGADLGEKLQYMDEDAGDSLTEWQDLFAGVAFSLASQITSKSYMQSVTGLFDAINDPNMSASSFTSQFAGSFIPSGVGELARQVDPVQRESYNFITKWKSRIPYMSKELAPKLDMWAREVKHGTSNVPVDVVNPFFMTKENYMPIDQEFELQGWSIPPSIKSFTVEKAEINLKARPEIRNFMLKTERQTPPSSMGESTPAIRRLIKKYGDYSMVDLMNMIVSGNHPLYRRYMEKTEGPDGGKVGMLKTIRNDYYEAAKEAAFKKFPELELDIINAQAKKAEKQRDIESRRAIQAFGDRP